MKYRSRISIVLVFVLNLIFAHAESASPGKVDFRFLKLAGSGGQARALAVQGDGKVVLGGEFTSLGGISRNRIARLNADGSLDSTFDPGSGGDGLVSALSLQPDGKVLIGGGFSSVNGTSLNRLARLNADGSLDGTFNPGSGATGLEGSFVEVSALVLQPDGKVLVGGAFNSVNGVNRNGIARLNSDGSVDSSFDPGTGFIGTSSTLVHDMAVQTDGKVVVGGSFYSFNGNDLPGLVRLNSDGSLDASFASTLGFSAGVRAVAIDTAGKVVVGGNFTSIHGITRNGIARLNADGSLDANFTPGSGADDSVFAISLQTDGKVLVGGWFNTFNGTSRSRVARLNSDGTVDESFDAGTIAGIGVEELVLQTDGKVLLGGRFTAVNGFAPGGPARLNVNGTLDTEFNPVSGANSSISIITTTPQSNVFVGGDFTRFNGHVCNRVARLHSDGKLDASFDPGAGPDATVRAIKEQNDGKVIIGGAFTVFNGVSRNRIARLVANGGLDTTFDPGIGANDYVSALTVQTDGKVLLGGNFTSFNGVTRNRIARLNTDGSVDASFNPGSGASTTVNAVAVQSDGKILIGGYFASYNGITRNGVARLNTDGTLDTSFDPGSGATSVLALAVRPNGQMIVAGNFDVFGGMARSKIAQLNADGSLDTTFVPVSGISGVVNAIAVQVNGKIVLAGSFSSAGGSSRNGIFRLNTDGSLDASFDPGTGASHPATPGIPYTLASVAIKPDGQILLGGNLSYFDGTPRDFIAGLYGDVPVFFPVSSSVYSGSGGSGSIAVEAAAGYAWQVVNTNNWITITSGATGNGVGVIGYTVAALDDNGERTGTVSVGGAAFSVSQFETLQAPAISLQPVNQTAQSGGQATLSVMATGTPAVSYQWRKNGVSINGATNATYAIASVQLTSLGTYDVVVSNSVGSVTSNGAILALPSGALITWGSSIQPAISAPAGVAFAQVAAGFSQVLVLQEDGTIATGGDSSQSTLPAGLTNARAVSAGQFHSLALTMDGTVKAWGNNSFGQLSVPSGLTNVIAIAAGGYHSLALKADGTIAAWGDNNFGQRNVPFDLNDVVSIAAGDFHSVALKADGSVRAWGANASSQIVIPVGLGGVTAIAAGARHNLALKGDGTVAAWGDNASGQAAVPAGLAEVAAIAAGADHSLALKRDGTVVVWGSNNFGQRTVPSALTNVLAIAGGGRRSLALVASAPAIITSPADQLTVTGLSASFSVTASGTGPLGYQWRKDGMNITGATNASHTIASAQSGHVGIYDVIVSNNAGSVTSASAQLLLDLPPAISQQPMAKTLTAGGTLVLAVRATGSPPLQLQWRKDGVNIPGETNSTYVASNVESGQAGNYDVVVTNPISSVTSSSASVLVKLRPEGALLSWGGRPFSFFAPGTVFTRIAAGGLHSVALKWDGTIAAWGYNLDGQCNVPDELTGMLAVSAGGRHNLALRADGTIVAWGDNSAGQSEIPSGLGPIKEIAAGGLFSVALKADQTVVVWGANNFGQSSVPVDLTNVTAISAGDSHAAALKSDGTVVVWGRNLQGELDVPVGLSEVAAIAAGGSHTLALRRDGTVVGWGRNAEGQVTVPASVTNASMIAAGGSHSLALRTDGTVIAWGDNIWGQSNLPSGLTNVLAIAAGATFSLALQEDGSIAAWGRDVAGETLPSGNANLTALAASVPFIGFESSSIPPGNLLALRRDGTVTVSARDDFGQFKIPTGLSNVTQIAAGHAHFLAVKTDGTVAGWGGNISGRTVPESLSNVVSVAAGASHSLALKWDGTVVGWGTIVPFGLANVAAVAAARNHSMALLQDGTVESWAEGADNLGEGTVPPGLSNVTAIATGYAHSLALKSDGTVVAWGDDAVGQTSVPAGLSNVVAISAGQYHNLALKADTTVVAWGYNASGQATVPAGLTNVVAIAAGGDFSAVLVSRGDDAPPSILRHPQNQTVLEGAGVTFEVLATALAPPAYQWRKNGVDIAGATNAFYTLMNVGATHAGRYDVVVSNDAGSAASAEAILTVNVPPSITNQPASQTTLAAGNDLVFNVQASGTEPLYYQWLKDGVEIPGATESSFGRSALEPGDAGSYTVVVSNAAGSTVSSPAELIVTCAYSLGVSGAIFGAEGGDRSVEMVAAAGCAWQTVNTNAWITITSGVGGSGNGSVNYTVAANASSLARSGTVVIAGVEYSVTQSGVLCTYSLSAASASFTEAGGIGSVSITVTAGDCSWQTVNTNAWITITSGAGGSGNGAVSYTVAANASSLGRSGTVTIAGVEYAVTQSGVACTYSLSAASASFTEAGGIGSVSITATASDCSWQTVNTNAWITITSGVSGNGNGAVSYTVAANASSLGRSGTVVIAGVEYSVTQSGVACAYSLSVASASFTEAGGNGSVSVTATASDCSWQTVNTNSWITITDGAGGSGNGTVSYTVAASSSHSPRVGEMTIAGIQYVVSQAEAEPKEVLLNGKVRFHNGDRAVPGVEIAVSGGVAENMTTDSAGSFQFSLNPGGSYVMTPSKASETPPAQGVSTLDITLIRRHVLGIAAMDSPYKILAADVNGSSSVTTLDITFIRRLILGITTNYPGGSLWRFVRSDVQFSDPLLPWSYESTRSYTNLTSDVADQDFVGIKLGDVNGSWTAPAAAEGFRGHVGVARPVADVTSGKISRMGSERRSVRGGGRARVKVVPREARLSVGGIGTVGIAVDGVTELSSTQFTLRWDPAVLEFGRVAEQGPSRIGPENFGLHQVGEGHLTFSWDSPDGGAMALTEDRELFAVEFRAKGPAGSVSVVEVADSPTRVELTAHEREVAVESESARFSINAGDRFPMPADSALRLVFDRERGLIVTGTLGARVRIEFAESLSGSPQWTELRTLVLGSGEEIVPLTDVLGASRRFYRAVQER